MRERRGISLTVLAKYSNIVSDFFAAVITVQYFKQNVSVSVYPKRVFIGGNGTVYGRHHRLGKAQKTSSAACF